MHKTFASEALGDTRGRAISYYYVLLTHHYITITFRSKQRNYTEKDAILCILNVLRKITPPVEHT